MSVYVCQVLLIGHSSRSEQQKLLLSFSKLLSICCFLSR